MKINLRGNDNNRTMQDWVNEYNATYQKDLSLKQAYKTFGLVLLLVGLVLFGIGMFHLIDKSSKSKGFGKFTVCDYDVTYEIDENGLEHKLKRLKYEYYLPSGERAITEDDEYIETYLEIGDVVDYSELFYSQNDTFNPKKLYVNMFMINNFTYIIESLFGGIIIIASVVLLNKSRKIEE